MLYSIDAYAFDRIPEKSPDKTAWFDAYGIWFAGKLRTAIMAKHGRKCWPYLDKETKKLIDGEEYDVDVWGKQAKLIFWVAQGYPRGIIVMPGEEELLEEARQISYKKPWLFDEVLQLQSRPDSDPPKKDLTAIVAAAAEQPPPPESEYASA